MVQMTKRARVLIGGSSMMLGLALAMAAEPVVVTGRAVSSGQEVPWNGRILRILETMPQGGGYAADRAAIEGLSKAVMVDPLRITVDPRLARTNFCSGATYLVFAKLMENLQGEGRIRLSADELQRLAVKGQSDGMGVWGRWNANGPGVARLFYESGLGRNFESFDAAQPGDFMKIFWTDQIGAKEFGHMVVYLGRRKDATGATIIRFWSSNKPGGYGTKEVPLTKIRWVIFSRLLNLDRLGRLPASDSVDPVSREMLRRSFSREEVRRHTGMPAPPVRAEPTRPAADR